MARCGAAPAATFATPEPWPGQVVTSAPHSAAENLHHTRIALGSRGLVSEEKIMSAVTCSEQRDGAEVGELRVRDVELGEGLDVVVDLADAGRHLLDVDGRVVAGEAVLLVADYDGQQAGDGHLAADLRQPQHEEVAPAVPHQTHLALVPAPSHTLVTSCYGDLLMGHSTV